MDRLLQIPLIRRAVLINLSCLALMNSVFAQEFPYVAYVTGEQVYVRSGPSQRHYPTGQIPQGYAVEVYRHDAEGWCAVRPPEGSFSWVPSHQVRSTERGIVEVVDNHVVARVGSTLSSTRSAVQVLLPKGERLEQLFANDDGDPRWVRIAAPAGEFRWVAASDLSRQPPVEVAPAPATTGSGWMKQSDRSPTREQAEPSVFDHLIQSNVPSNSGLMFGTPSTQSLGQPLPVQPLDPNAMEVVAGSPAELQLAQFQAEATSLAPPALAPNSAAATLASRSSQPRVRFRGLSSAAAMRVDNVEELELRLSQAVVLPPQQWELSPLEAAANSLLAETKTPSVRAQLREVLDRITRFQEVQDRYENPAPPILAARDPFDSARTIDESPTLTGMSASVRQRIREDLSADQRVAGAESPAGPRYDAAGLLKPVISKRENAPQYALVDEKGKVVSFLTPTPDLNLKPYVGRRIGVNGTRGFIPEYRRAHVTAGRVTPIDQPIRR